MFYHGTVKKNNLFIYVPTLISAFFSSEFFSPGVLHVGSFQNGLLTKNEATLEFQAK